MRINNFGRYNSWEDYYYIQNLEKQTFEENLRLIQKLLKENLK